MNRPVVHVSWNDTTAYGVWAEELTPVDEFESNGYGLYNVSGNVWEWCSDLFHSSPSSGSPLWQWNSDLIGTRSPTSSVASGGYGG
jgi:formylglycine-generating enzyme required for sulfatase activity